MSQQRKSSFSLLSKHAKRKISVSVSTGRYRRRTFGEAMQSVFGSKRKAVMWFLSFVVVVFREVEFYILGGVAYFRAL